jgi:uncharacterized membrane protein (UPF0127 family)
MKFKRVKIKRKSFNAKICSSFLSQAIGLMFKKNSPPLLFIFRKPVNLPIHSCFCRPFRAVWFNKDKIIDDKIVNPFSFSVRPNKLFTALLEIPFPSKESRFPTENRKV